MYAPHPRLDKLTPPPPPDFIPEIQTEFYRKPGQEWNPVRKNPQQILVFCMFGGHPLQHGARPPARAAWSLGGGGGDLYATDLIEWNYVW
jgi:hypothetical protein